MAATADEPVPDGFQGLDAVHNNYRKSASVNGRPARASYTATVEANPPDVPSSRRIVSGPVALFDQLSVTRAQTVNTIALERTLPGE